MFIKFQSNNNPFVALAGFAITLLLLYGFVMALGWVLYGLYAFGWLLIPIILWVNAKVLGIYLTGILDKWRKGVALGLIATVTMLAFYPFILLYILFTGFLSKKLQATPGDAGFFSKPAAAETEYADYEEVSSEKMDQQQLKNQ